MTKMVEAKKFLEVAAQTMIDRAAQRDSNKFVNGSSSRTSTSGERSMAATVGAFNSLTGHNLNESEGWEFMVLLKLVRGRQGDFREDDYVDASAYCALLGECSSKVEEVEVLNKPIMGIASNMGIPI